MATGALIPLHVFKFEVDFFTDSLSDDGSHEQFPVCSGAFAECTGLEATMEPKVVKEGGRNYGAAQRAGYTTFATVVLKRGISTNQNMYQIFNSVSTGTFAPRMQVNHQRIRCGWLRGACLAARQSHAGEVQVCRSECEERGDRH